MLLRRTARRAAASGCRGSAHPATRRPGRTGRRSPATGGGAGVLSVRRLLPELAAVRWAARHGVAVVACDLPLADPAWGERGPTGPPTPVTVAGLADALRARLSGRAGRRPVGPARSRPGHPGSPPRGGTPGRAAVGWALRDDAGGGPGWPRSDLRREARMRQRLGRGGAAGGGGSPPWSAPSTPPRCRSASDRPAAAAPADDARPSPADAAGTRRLVTSLVPYAFELLDARSGYPAGIRDPQWQQSVLAADGDPAALEAAPRGRPCGRVRGSCAGRAHRPGRPRPRETVRLALDLARLRGLPAPGRGELVEAVQTRARPGRAYGPGPGGGAGDGAGARRHARRGRPARTRPVPGSAPAVEAEVAALRLPGPESPRARTGAPAGPAALRPRPAP